MSLDWRRAVGERVVVRHRLAEGGLTDTVGELVEIVDGVPPAAARLVVRTRDGATRRVPLADVVAGRVVPPRPARAAPPHRALSVADLERVMARHWLPADTERLGDWLLRAANGFTGRGNSVLVVGDPGLPLPAALERVRAWYGARGLPPLAAVPDPAAEPVRAALAEDGWRERPGASAVVLTAPTRALAAAPVALPAGYALDLAPTPDDDWLAAYRYRGQPLPPGATGLLTSAPEQVFARVTAGGSTVAVARGSLAAAWTGVTAVEVGAAHRRRGLARALLGALAGWGLARSAASTYLQVAETNTAALALYQGAGLEPHHRYDYLEAGPRPA